MKTIGKIINCGVLAYLIALASILAQPSLDSFPQKQEIWLAIVKGKLEAKNSVDLFNTGDTHIDILKEPGSRAEKGELLAILDQQQLDLSERSLKLAKKQFELAVEEAVEKIDSYVNNLSTELSKLEQNKHLISQSLRSSSDSKLQAKLKKIQGVINKKITTLEKKISASSIENKRLIAIEELKLNLEKKEKEFSLAKRRAEITAPFDGVFSLYLNEADYEKDGESYWVPSGTKYAKIENNSEFYMTVSNRSPIFSSHSSDSLSAKIIVGSNRQVIDADFKTKRDTALPPPNNYELLFLVAEEDVELAKHNNGAIRAIHIYQNFAEPVYIVRKQSLLSIAPAVLKRAGWRGLIAHLYPHQKLVGIGPQSLAISVKNEH